MVGNLAIATHPQRRSPLGAEDYHHQARESENPEADQSGEENPRHNVCCPDLRAIESLEGRSDRFVFPHILGRGADARGFIDPVAGEPWSSGSIASIKLRKLREAAIEERAKKVAEIPSSQFLAGLESVGPTKLVAYANRHAYASEGSSLGFSDEQIAEQLGNTPNVFRRVYAHTVDDAAARRAQQIAEGRRSGVRRSESRG